MFCRTHNTQIINRDDFNHFRIVLKTLAVIELREISSGSHAVAGLPDKFPNRNASVFQRMNDGVAMQAMIFRLGIHIIRILSVAREGRDGADAVDAR